MADVPIKLVLGADVDQFISNLDRADAAMSRLGDHTFSQANKAASGINILKNAAAGLAAAFSIGAIVKMTDAWTDMNSRVALAVGGQEKAAAVMERLNGIARTTYSSLGQTAEGFLANAATLEAMGYSTETQLKYTEALNNALVVSGAKGERAASVQNALNKAMAGGKLAGDQLNTIIDSGGRVSQLLADKLGVTTLELRKMGSEGKITSAVILDALVGSFDTLREEAGSMPATISDGMLLIGNSIQKAVGLFDQATKSSGSLSEQMVRLADFISDNAASWALWGVGVANAVGTAVGAISEFVSANSQMVAIVATGAAAYAAYTTIAPIFTGIATAIKGVSVAQAALNAVMALNPIGLVVAAVAALGAGLVFLTQKFLEANGISISFFDTLKVIGQTLWQTIAPAFEAIGNAISSIVSTGFGMLQSAIASVTGALAQFGIGWSDVLGVVKTFVNASIALFVAMYQSVVAIAQAIVDTFKNAFNSVGAGASRLGANIQAAMSDWTKLGNVMDGVGEAFAFEIPDFGAAVTGAVSAAYSADYLGEAFGAVTGVIDGFNEKLLENAAAQEAANIASEEAAAKLEAERNALIDSTDQLVGNTGAANDNAGAKNKAASASEKLTQALAKEAEQLRRQYDPSIGLNEKLNKYNQMVQNGLIDQKTYSLAVRDANLEAIDSFAELGNAGAIAFKGIQQAASGWLDTMIDGLIEGNMNWGDFAKNILKDLAKIALQAALSPILKNLFGGIAGGTTGAGGAGATGKLAGLFGKNAVGGRVGSGFKIYGERGPEAVYQNGNGTVLTAAQTQAMLGNGGSGGSGGNVYIGDINVSVPEGTTPGDARKISRAVEAGVMGAVNKNMANNRRPQTLRG